MMPQMRAAFGGWTRKYTLVRVVQCVVDGLVSDKQFPIVFQGTIQPLGAREIALKPEGQRAWEWIQIHMLVPRQLENNDRIVYDGRWFKVMGTTDYSLNGYVEYHVVRDYQDANG